MPLVIDGGRVPPRWGELRSSHSVVPIDSYGAKAECIRVALINNMPDAALEDTELQFFELLDSASGDHLVLLRLYSLTGVPRTDRGMPHLNKFYFDIDDLWSNHFDALIMTGTEPRQPNLREEPYWRPLVNVLEWAERNTVSTILSCLAAHAGALHSDGIERHRLSDKQFGVFDFKSMANHPLTEGVGGMVRFPHSRWNEVRAEDLTSCGYAVLSNSTDAGVDTFVKRKNKSLFVHFQGHPEYTETTLLKEYRRDVRRFLRRERDTYPSLPYGYFDAAATEVLCAFRDRALKEPTEEVMEAFPDAALGNLQRTWRSSAFSIYRNWLGYVKSSKEKVRTFPAVANLYPSRDRKRSAMP